MSQRGLKLFFWFQFTFFLSLLLFVKHYFPEGYAWGMGMGWILGTRMMKTWQEVKGWPW